MKDWRSAEIQLFDEVLMVEINSDPAEGGNHPYGEHGNAQESERPALPQDSSDGSLEQTEAVQPSVPASPSQLGERLVVKHNQPWTSIASFTLEFQTRSVDHHSEQQVVVQYIEGDDENVWTALDDDTIYPWVLHRVTEALEHLPQAEQPRIAPPAIEITQIRFLQPLAAGVAITVDETHVFPQGLLHSNEPIALEVTFKLVGLDVAELIQQALPYQIQGKLHNRMTGANISVGSNQLAHLIENQYSYTICLPDVKLSPGPYQLDIVVTLHHASVPPTLFEVPILQIV